MRAASSFCTPRESIFGGGIWYRRRRGSADGEAWGSWVLFDIEAFRLVAVKWTACTRGSSILGTWLVGACVL